MTIIEQKKEKVKAYLYSIHKLNKDTYVLQEFAEDTVCFVLNLIKRRTKKY